VVFGRSGHQPVVPKIADHTFWDTYPGVSESPRLDLGLPRYKAREIAATNGIRNLPVVTYRTCYAWVWRRCLRN
jgi:hypothetical protein